MQVRSYPNSFRGNFATAGWEYVQGMNLVGEAPRVAEEAEALLKAPPCPAGRRTIVLDGGQLALQVHESCGHPIELDRVLGMELSYAGDSFLTIDKLGTFQYGSPQVNIVADATAPGGLGTFGWDDEGVPAQRTPIIDAGRFVGYLSSRETAPAVGRTSSGAMRASGWHRIPLIRMTNVNLLPGAAGGLEDLLADTGDGLFLATNKSWSIDNKRLNFQFGTEMCREIKGGRLGQIYKNATYTGITPEFWNACDAVCGPAGVAPVGHAQLRQGRAEPDGPRGPRHGAGPVPQRPGRSASMSTADREARLLEIGREAVRASPADETEILLSEGRDLLTRFSTNRIHQNVGVEEVWAAIRVVVGKRIGVATAGSLQPEALAGARDEALAIARAADPVDDWPGLPPPRPVQKVDGYDPATAETAAEARADMAGAIIAAAKARKAEAAGAVEVEESSLAVVSSAGVEVASSSTKAQAHTVMTCEDGSGYAEGISPRIGDLDGRAIGRRAAAKAAGSRKPRAVEPGRYDVVLEPAAVAEWLEYLSYIAFSGKNYEEGRSPLSGKLGQSVTGEAVTIWDNALDPRTIPMSFDFEGMPKERLTLISRGVAKAVATGHYRARRLKKRRSTGSALPSSTSYECLPLHLFMKGGESSAARLVKDTKRGLLVTRFHYTNILDPLKTVLTGMTRDGTFLVENGEVVGPVRNLRYTENVLEALGRIDGASRRLVLSRGGPCVVPTLRLRGVQFTGTTEF